MDMAYVLCKYEAKRCANRAYHTGRGNRYYFHCITNGDWVRGKGRIDADG